MLPLNPPPPTFFFLFFYVFCFLFFFCFLHGWTVCALYLVGSLFEESGVPHIFVYIYVKYIKYHSQLLNLGKEGQE